MSCPPPLPIESGMVATERTGDLGPIGANAEAW